MAATPLTEPSRYCDHGMSLSASDAALFDEACLPNGPMPDHYSSWGDHDATMTDLEERQGFAESSLDIWHPSMGDVSFETPAYDTTGPDDGPAFENLDYSDFGGLHQNSSVPEQSSVRDVENGANLVWYETSTPTKRAFSNPVVPKGGRSRRRTEVSDQSFARDQSDDGDDTIVVAGITAPEYTNSRNKDTTVPVTRRTGRCNKNPTQSFVSTCPSDSPEANSVITSAVTKGIPEDSLILARDQALRDHAAQDEALISDQVDKVKAIVHNVLHATSTCHLDRFVHMVDPDLPQRGDGTHDDFWKDRVTHVIIPIVQQTACTIVLASRGDEKVKIVTAGQCGMEGTQIYIDQAVQYLKALKPGPCTRRSSIAWEQEVRRQSLRVTTPQSASDYALPVLLDYLHVVVGTEGESTADRSSWEELLTPLLSGPSAFTQPMEQDPQGLAQLLPTDPNFFSTLHRSVEDHKTTLPGRDNSVREMSSFVERISRAPKCVLRSQALADMLDMETKVREFLAINNGLPRDEPEVARKALEKLLSRVQASKEALLIGMKNQESAIPWLNSVWKEDTQRREAQEESRAQLLARKIQEAQKFCAQLSHRLYTGPDVTMNSGGLCTPPECSFK